MSAIVDCLLFMLWIREECDNVIFVHVSGCRQWWQGDWGDAATPPKLINPYIFPAQSVFRDHVIEGSTRRNFVIRDAVTVVVKKTPIN